MPFDDVFKTPQKEAPVNASAAQSNSERTIIYSKADDGVLSRLEAAEAALATLQSQINTVLTTEKSGITADLVPGPVNALPFYEVTADGILQAGLKVTTPAQVVMEIALFEEPEKKVADGDIYVSELNADTNYDGADLVVGNDATAGLKRALLNFPYETWLDCQFDMAGESAFDKVIVKINVVNYIIQAGDVLEYDLVWVSGQDFSLSKIIVSLYPPNTNALLDQNGIDSGSESSSVTGLADMCQGKWYHRSIRLDGASVGQEIDNFCIECATAADPEHPTDPIQLEAGIANIRITDGAGTVRHNVFSSSDALPTFSEFYNSDVANTWSVVEGNHPHLGFESDPEIVVLRLAYNGAPNEQGLTAARLAASFLEASTTWNNQPAAGEAIDSCQAKPAGMYASFMLSGFYRRVRSLYMADGTFSLDGFLVEAAEDLEEGEVSFFSKETAATDDEKPHLLYWFKPVSSKLVGANSGDTRLLGRAGGTYWFAYRFLDANNNPSAWSMPVQYELPGSGDTPPAPAATVEDTDISSLKLLKMSGVKPTDFDHYEVEVWQWDGANPPGSIVTTILTAQDQILIENPCVQQIENQRYILLRSVTRSGVKSAQVGADGDWTTSSALTLEAPGAYPLSLSMNAGGGEGHLIAANMGDGSYGKWYVVEGASPPAFYDILDERDVPSGIISLWYGTVASIPSGWQLCDGTNGSPDMRGRFARGAPAGSGAGATGGEDTHALTTGELPAHNHGSAGSHSHGGGVGGGGSHSHNILLVGMQTGSGSWYNAVGGSWYGGYIATDGYHGHSISSDGGHTHTSVGSGTAHENRPAYRELLYIMKL